MGKSTAETVKELEATRARLDAQLKELQKRLPAPAQLVKRLAGGAAVDEAEGARARLDEGVRELQRRVRAPVVYVKRLVGFITGGAALGVLAWLVGRARRHKKKGREGQPVDAVVHIVPEGWEESLTRARRAGRWKTVAVVAVGAALTLRAIQVRQRPRSSESSTKTG